MSSGGENSEVDTKMFMKAVQDQFAKLNMRLDNLGAPSRTSSGKNRSPVVDESNS